MNLIEAYQQLVRDAQSICDQFPYAERLTAQPTLTLHDGIPQVHLGAVLEMSPEREAELRAAGVVAPTLLAFTSFHTCPDAALSQLAERLAVEWPVRYATGEQRRDLVRVLNQPEVKREEKSRVLLNLLRLTETQAEGLIRYWNVEVENRKPVHQRRVVGEAYQTSAA